VTWRDLWIKYIATRSIASEVNTTATTFRTLYINFAVPEDLVKMIKDLMAQGGWTTRELQIFDIDLELRKRYRILTALIPTMRQFVSDALYLIEWTTLIDDLLKARGIDVEKYKAQIEYYKKLVRNRRVFRHISWYRTRLTNAYAKRVIDDTTLMKKLESLKQFGLGDDEIQLILDGIKLEAMAKAAR
jgi:hypothetical protein